MFFALLSFVLFSVSLMKLLAWCSVVGGEPGILVLIYFIMSSIVESTALLNLFPFGNFIVALSFSGMV